MSHLLMAIIAVLAVLILGFAWFWLVVTPKSRKIPAYSETSDQRAIRNHAWDAAVARERRHRPSQY
jgi:beta-lactam-binding protein with PASTA domain